MDVKLQILTETFQDEFSIPRFTRFTREFLNTIEIVNPNNRIKNYLPESTYHIHSHTHIANYTDSERNIIAIFAVELNRGRSIERARSMQRNFISKLIAKSGHDAAIVAFYVDGEPLWRLSLVRLDYAFVAGQAKLNITPAKRYSYLVGKGEPCHTAMEQLYPIFRDEQYNPTLDKIEEAFSIEAITKEFFDKYKEKYLQLKEYLDSNEQFNDEAKRHQFTSEQFAKKLMGQLVFLYFLQKKGWLGVKVLPHTINEKQYKNAYYNSNKAAREIVPKVYQQTGMDQYMLKASSLFQLSDSEADILAGCFKSDPWGSGTKTFIRDLYDACLKSKGKNYFDDYLEPLFYEALNKKRGVNNFYKKFNCKIPFLNGGLFEPLKSYDWEHTRFGIPNELFSNPHIKGNKDADGILDVFDHYNFTMNEDEPLEREVAVDPEMLGKIFENLLDVKDRKSKGAFYTPREIVHYMCQESIINYLVNKTDVPYEEMKDFILYGELMKDEDCGKEASHGKQQSRIPESVYNKLGEIDKALENVKVADPAVGSGAFPLGMLSEIVKARSNITEYFVQQIPKEKKFDRLLMYRNRDPYRIKWNTIKNCIFAVDIEASAVDIAKLRLWLSLVVDQEITSGNDDDPFITDDNKDPHPLPNLDYNIMCGNSLIDEFEGVQLFDDSLLTREQHDIATNNIDWQMSLFSDTVERLTEDLFKEQDRLFGEEDVERKLIIKTNIDKLIDGIIRAKLSRENNTSGLIKYEESLKQKTKPFFLWKLEFAKVFKEKGGFDIVIGNPPYVGQKGHKEIFQEIKKTVFGGMYHQRRMDLFYFFFHKGIDLLKTNGTISYITTNYYLTSTYADKLRADIRNRTSILRLVDFNEMKIFESALGQHNMITILEKSTNKKFAKTCMTFNKGYYSDLNLIMNILSDRDENTNYFIVAQSDLYDGINNYIRLEGTTDRSSDLSDVTSRILKKISQDNILLKDICEINTGIQTGADKVTQRHIENYQIEEPLGKGIFILSDEEIEALNLNENEKSLIKPYFKNSDIYRWGVNSNNLEKIIYYCSKNNYENIENIKRYLDKFKIVLVNRNVRAGKITLEQYDKFVDNEFEISYVMIASEMKKGNYYCLSYARNIKMFKNPKIVVSQRTKGNVFGYTEKELYGGSGIFFINEKNNDFNLKFILSLLNSKLYYYWLYHKGKRKGDLLEIIVKPLSEIPIKKILKEQQIPFINLVNQILVEKRVDPNADTSSLEAKIDKLVYELYELTDEEVKIVEGMYWCA